MPIRLTRGGTALLVLACAVVAYAQKPKEPPPASVKEDKPTTLHLVGHEEAALLAIIQDALDDWDPRSLDNPYLKPIKPANPNDKVRYAIRRKDLLEFIADPDAAVALGKAFFWEMQAGSDFDKVGANHVGTACASCHFRFGQDSRQRHTTRVPFVGWDQYQLDDKHPMPKNGPYDPQKGQFKQLPQQNNVVVPNFLPANWPNPDKFDGKPRWQPHPNDDPKNLSLIVGSQGVVRRLFAGFDPDRPWKELWTRAEPLVAPKHPEEWQMFGAARQITNRNAPTVINATFADRLFHDGRAESTFNGFSIFGDRDDREVLHKRSSDGTRLIPVKMALSHAALASQAVGPIVNEVEMSYKGRTFPDLAKKLLNAKILFAQKIDDNDSVFAGMQIQDGTYRDLIKKAFRQEWWNDAGITDNAVILELGQTVDGKKQRGPLMAANFSLYWGLALLLYQSTLISNDSPFDRMMRGNAEGIWDAWKRHKDRIGNVHLDLAAYTRPSLLPLPKVPRDEIDEASRLRAKLLEAGRNGTVVDNPKIIATAVFQRGMRVFAKHDCRDCHSGPNLSELSDRTANHRSEDGISKLLAHTLFPNAQGDAAGVVLANARAELMARVAQIIQDKDSAITAVEARVVATELLGALTKSEGDFVELRSRVRIILAAHIINDSAVTPTVQALQQFELTVRDRFGRRPFFNEVERIATAERITDPVLIEKMVIPFTQVFARRPLPTGGLPSAPHAFYDAGFYALGVTHPRFDRGIGRIITAEQEADETDIKRSKSIQQSAGGAGGSANRIPAKAKTQKKDEGDPKKNDDPKKKDAITSHFDPSWSRTELYPELSVEQMRQLHRPHRRSQTDFLARARQLVVDEEPWGHRKPFLHDNELAFWSAFKTPTLRNVELTGPYMHNGQLLTLEEVIEFYDAGGHIDRSQDFNPDKHPRMRRQNMTTDDKKALLFFLLCLTDEAVRTARGVFDHPSLCVPNGLVDGKEVILEIPKRGRTGGAENAPFPSDK